MIDKPQLSVLKQETLERQLQPWQPQQARALVFNILLTQAILIEYTLHSMATD